MSSDLKEEPAKTEPPKAFLKKALSPDADAVIIAVSAPHLLADIFSRQGPISPTASEQLGKAIISAALIQGLNDYDDKEEVHMQWKTSSALGSIYADSWAPGKVRGTLSHPQESLEALGASIGSGILQVRHVKDKKESSGIVQSTGYVNSDVEEYLRQSAQKLCGVGLSVQLQVYEDDAGGEFLGVESALGYLIHILPEADEQKRDYLLHKWNDQMRILGAPSKWALAEDDEEATKDMIRLLSFSDGSREILSHEIRFECTCSEEKVRKLIQLTEENERMRNKNSIHESTQALDVRCQYCGHVYVVPQVQA